MADQIITEGEAVIRRYLEALSVLDLDGLAATAAGPLKRATAVPTAVTTAAQRKILTVSPGCGRGDGRRQ